MVKNLGFVAIGRNEGDRLRRCLESLRKTGAMIVYVDSGSSDGSVSLARQMGAEVAELDLSVAFNASRARNRGWQRLLEIMPMAELVHFIDGDCSLAEGWLETAVAELDRRADCAVVCGHRRELYPNASVYNQFTEVEWAGAVGEVQSCGGDALMRITALQQVGGYDQTVPAGEEPEMCARLRKQGWKIIALDHDMTWHDAAMVRFGQWWRRQFRTGYNGLDVARRFGSGNFAKHSRSARVWTLGPLALLVIAVSVGGLCFGFWGVMVGCLIVVGIVLAQAFRIGRRGAGIVYGIMTVVSKWAQLFGQIQYYVDLRHGRSGRLIEYKHHRASARLVAPLGLPKETE